MFMSKSSTISMRVDQELKTTADEIFSRLGMTMTQAVTLFLQQVEYHRGLPFAVKLPENESLIAIQDALERRNLTRHESVEAMFDHFDED